MKTPFVGALGVGAALVLSVGLAAQGPLDPSLLLKPPTDAWTSYHGDYTGRHYSPLAQIDASNAKALSMAWYFRTTASTENAIVSGAAVAPGTPGAAGP